MALDLVAGTFVGRWYVTLFGLAYMVYGTRILGARRLAVYSAIAFAVAVVSENASVVWGVPYTVYSFNQQLRSSELFIGNVPLAVPLSYTFVMFFSRVAVFAIDSYLRGNDERRERGGGLGYFAQSMLIYVFDMLFTLLSAPLIYYFSRVREYKADAGSARLSSRENMIHALEALKTCTQVQDNRAPGLSAFKINGRGHGLMAHLFASHPSLDARIEALRRLEL